METTITAILMAMIMALTDDGNGIPRGPLAPLLIGLLIAVIGASMGPLTGFALNPARLRPKTVYQSGRVGLDRLPVISTIPYFGAAAGAGGGGDYRAFLSRSSAAICRANAVSMSRGTAAARFPGLMPGGGFFFFFF